eukprot:14431315-Alexandrium_andersonii.AAC.1
MAAEAPVAGAGEVAVPKTTVSGAPIDPSHPAATAAKAGEPQDPPGLASTKTEAPPAAAASHQPCAPPAPHATGPPAPAPHASGSQGQ